MRSLTRTLYRNRRRALITFVAFFCFGALSTLSNGDPFHVLQALFVGTALGLIMMVSLMCLALLVPAWRALMEITSVCSVALASVQSVAPDFLNVGPAWFPVAALWAAGFGIGSLYAGTVLDRFTLRENGSHSGIARTPLAQDVVWTGLYGLPGDRGVRCEGDALLAHEPVEGAPDTYRIVERTKDLQQIEEFQQMELRDAPHSVRFRWWVPSASTNEPLSRGTLSATLTPTRQGGTKVTATYTIERYSSRMALFAWVDDHFGRTLDGYLTNLEDLSQGPAPAAVPAE